MHAPQIIWIVLTAIGVGANTQESPRKGVVAAISAGIVAGLLWWGGFFG